MSKKAPSKKVEEIEKEEDFMLSFIGNGMISTISLPAGDVHKLARLIYEICIDLKTDVRLDVNPIEIKKTAE